MLNLHLNTASAQHPPSSKAVRRTLYFVRGGGKHPLYPGKQALLPREEMARSARETFTLWPDLSF